MNKRIVIAAVLGGLIGGALDIEAAVLISGAAPDVIMRAIARGLLGKAAMQGGMPATLLGLALQLGMGALIGLIYGLGCLRFANLARNWALGGLTYGVVLFLAMNWVVVPLSAIHRFPKLEGVDVLQNGGAMLAFGLIVALAAHLGQRRVR